MSNKDSSPSDSSWDRLAEVFFGRLAPIAAATCGMTIGAAFFTYYQTKDAETSTRFLAWAFVFGFFVIVIVLLLFVENRNNRFRRVSRERGRAIELLETQKGDLDQDLLNMQSDLQRQIDERIESLQLTRTNLNDLTNHLKQLHSRQEISSSDLLPLQKKVSNASDEVLQEIKKLQESRGDVSLGVKTIKFSKENPDYYKRTPKRELNQ